MIKPALFIAASGLILTSLSSLGFSDVVAYKSEIIKGKVVRVIDGDTFDLTMSDAAVKRIRLACIDAPERSQKPQGPLAKARLITLVQDQQVDVEVVNFDAKYGRVNGKVYKDNNSINVQLVKEGHAVIYPQYLKGCPELKDELNTSQEKAKAAYLNFWSILNPEMPWDYRKRIKVK